MTYNLISDNLSGMIIDFHTHYYPDDLAYRALHGVDDVCEGDNNGTYDGLKRAMLNAGVDRAVVLAVCNRPGHEEKINSFILGKTDETIIPFFSVHPYSENAPYLVRKYADLGIKGIKLHPNMQQFRLNDERLLPLCRAIRDSGIIALFHCGKPGRTATSFDVYPSDFLPLMDILDPEHTVLAHTGGYGISDSEINVLRSINVYTDLSLAASQFTPDRMKSILEFLPADRMLFGSDSPWRDIKASLDFIRCLCKNDTALQQLMHANAEKLLGLNG